MSPGFADPAGPRGDVMENCEFDAFLFLAELVHSGEYNIRINWGDVFGVLEKVRIGDVRRCCSLALQRGYTNGCDDDDPFMLLRTPKTSESSQNETLLQGLFDVLRQNAFVFNVALLFSLEKSLMTGIMGAFSPTTP